MKILAKETVRGNTNVIMRYAFLCFLFLVGTVNCLLAQDKIVLRNGKTIDVKVHRSTESDVYYTYPGETSVYERPKSVISYIIYSDGRREIFDESLRSSDSNTPTRPATSGTTAPASRNRLLEDEDVYWQDVKTTYMESDVKGMIRLQRISVSSSISYRDAIQQLKKKAAEIGGTTILVMDSPENEDVEVMGIAFREEKMETIPRNANERTTVPVESSANTRRRQIAQQMESYNNESDLQYEDNSRNARSSSTTSRATTQPSRSAGTQPRQSNANNAEPDAIYLTNGRVVRGIIEELEPDDFVSIRTSTGRIYEYSMDDVRRISHESGRSNVRPSAPTSSSPRSNTGYDANRYNDNNRGSSRYNDDNYDDYAVSGYKGIFDVGYNLPLGVTGEKGNFEINTSHGYQINEYLFAGAGLGLHLYNARDSAMRNQNTYPHYVVGSVGANGKLIPADSSAWLRADTFSFMTLPIFLDIRGYLPLQNSSLAPFAMCRFGYSFCISDGFQGMGLFVNPALGLKYNLSPKFGLNFTIGYAFQHYGGIPEDNNKTKPKDVKFGYLFIKDSSGNSYWAKGAHRFSLRLGIEF